MPDCLLSFVNLRMDVKSFLGPLEINQDIHIDNNYHIRSIMRADDQALNVTEYGKSF